MNVEQEIRRLTSRLDTLENRELDMKGRRAINAGRALAASDFLTLGQARELIASPDSTRVIEQHIDTVGGGPFGLPLSLGDTNQQGSSQYFADAQHIHASGLTTKGDLLGYSTTTTRVGVGTDGAPLTAFDGVTNGVSWTSPWKGSHTKNLVKAATTGIFEIALPTLTQCGGILSYQVRCGDATDVQSETAIVSFDAVNKGGAYTSSISAKAVQTADQSTLSTLTVTFSIATGANKITFQVNATSSLTPTSLDIRFFLSECSPQVVTFL